MTEDPSRWSQPFAALLGAYDVQLGLGLPSIGGKDSMSGTFNDIDVPPTLVSFAVDVTNRPIIAQKSAFLAREDGVNMSIHFQRKIGAGFFGGEGFFHTRITGPGKVYIQSMPVINTAQVLTPYLNIGSNDNGGGINIRLGD